MNTQLDQETTLLIEEHVRRLLETMGFSASVATSYRELVAKDKPPAWQVRINIEAGSAGRLLIGNQGQHLAALQQVVRSLVRRHLAERAVIVVDVNQYRSRRERTLIQLAEDVARQATRTGRTVVLRPMSPADRRAIHTALSLRSDVQTESLGDEPNRRVVVRPIFL